MIWDTPAKAAARKTRADAFAVVAEYRAYTNGQVNKVLTAQRRQVLGAIADKGGDVAAVKAATKKFE